MNWLSGSNLRSWVVLIGCVSLSAILLAIDVRMERSLVLGIPQILVVLLALLAHRTPVSIAGASLATLSIGLGHFLSPSGYDDATALVNRAIVGCTVWMTAAAGLAFERGAAAQRRLAEIVEAFKEL